MRHRVNTQIVVSKDHSGLSEILYALRRSKKNDGSSPFEKQMGREPNTVKSNLVSNSLDFSEQDPVLQIDQSHFQDDLDSTILAWKRARRTKLQTTFDKKVGQKIRESAHTITMIPESSNKPKTYAKGDKAITSRKQKEKFHKESGRQIWKGVLEETTSNSDSYGGKANRKKRAVQQAVAVSFEPDPEEEERPSILDIATSSTEHEARTSKPNEQLKAADQNNGDEKKGIEQNPREMTFPINATVKCEVKGTSPATPQRVLEKVRVPTKRYGIDFVQLNTEADK